MILTMMAAVQCDKGRGCSGEAGFERKRDETDDDNKSNTAIVICSHYTNNGNGQR